MRTRVVALAIVAAIGLACHGPTGPTTTGPTAVLLNLIGPARFAATSPPKFTVTATLSDGTQQDYSNRVFWAALGLNGTSPISITSSGVITVRSPGEATITVSLIGAHQASINVMVIPDGTYRLIGNANEAGLPLAGTTITVVGGAGAGLTTTTDGQGNYRLYGVAGPVQVEASKPGYASVVETATISADNVLDFPTMSEIGGPPSIAGTYSLTIVAASDCHVLNTPPLATVYRTRTYTAVVTQTGPVVNVVLSGATFRVQNGKGNQFPGRVSPGQVSFTLGDNDAYYGYYYYAGSGNPNIVDQVTSDSVLSFSGTANATISPTGIVGSFSGTIVTSLVAQNKTTESCVSNHHQFVMTPLSSTQRKRR